MLEEEDRRDILHLDLRFFRQKLSAPISLSRLTAEASESAQAGGAVAEEKAPSMGMAVAVSFFGFSCKRSSWLAVSKAS